jgi:hypothetical protein
MRLEINSMVDKINENKIKDIINTFGEDYTSKIVRIYDNSFEKISILNKISKYNISDINIDILSNDCIKKFYDIVIDMQKTIIKTYLDEK